MSESSQQASELSNLKDRLEAAMPGILDEVEERFGKPFRPGDRERLTAAVVAAASEPADKPARDGEQARVEWEARDKPAQTRATATDEQREIVRQEIRVYSHRNVDVLTNEFKAAKALVAVLADSEALAARNAPHLTLGDAVDALIAAIDGGKRPAEDARLVVNELSNWRFRKYPGPAPTARTRGEVMADISLIPGDTLWACACGERWVENGEGDQDMPAECGRCGGKMIVTGRLSDGAAISSDPRTLDLIMWSLRLPLLREAIGRVEARPGVLTGNTTELARLDALIAEGERALGILPEEEAS